MLDPIVSVKHVQFNYPAGVSAVNGVSLEVHQGERVALLGPNGSGKSTLILLIAGLLTPKKGEIKVFGEKTTSKDFQKFRSRIGIVFQDPDDQLFTPSVIEDIEYGKTLSFRGRRKAEKHTCPRKDGYQSPEKRPTQAKLWRKKKVSSLRRWS